MFVKIVRKSSRGDKEGKVWKTETTYECDIVHMKSSKNGLIFDIESSGDKRFSIEAIHGDPDFKESTTVYFMNREGRTVDSYYLEPQVKGTTPEETKSVDPVLTVGDPIV